MSFDTLQLGDGSLRILDYKTGNTVFHADADTKQTGTKVATIARTDTTAKNLFLLPANAIPIFLSVYSPAVSNAATTAVISIGKTGTNTFFVSSQDVKGVSGQIPCAAAANLGSTIGTAAIQVVGIYAETGTASTLGGPFTVILEYYLA